MPIITSIGQSLNMPEVMVIGTAFAGMYILHHLLITAQIIYFLHNIVSAAMGLPFSSFPNVNSLLIVDDFQRPYLNVQDYLKSGMLMSAIAIVLIATVGYALIELIIVA